MKKLILEIDSEYDDVITFTAVGRTFTGMNVTSGAYAIEDGDCITVGTDGKITQKHAD